MTQEQIEQLKKTIDHQLQKGIETHVNGKIRILHDEFREYKKDDEEWKKMAAPTIELGNNIRGFGKVVAYLLGIGGALFGLIKIIK